MWEKIFFVLAEDADNEYGMIDATIVRAYQHSAGAPKKRILCRQESEHNNDQAIGRSLLRLSTLIHTTYDALFNPEGFFLTVRQAHELDSADVLRHRA